MFKFFQKFSFGKKILSLFQRKVDAATIDELERLFFEADLGSELSSHLSAKATALLRSNSAISPEEILKALEEEILHLLNAPYVLPTLKASPHVIFMIGVNGSGKTTTSAKLAHFYKSQNKSVLLAAADTFRAGAVDQLSIWADRLKIDVVKGQSGGDPAAVCFDAIAAAKSRHTDLLIVDTAGRLHTRSDLIGELVKIRRVADKAQTGAPHETFLILDATTGQNAIHQAQIFHQAIPLTGLILTKMDGTAKGGSALAIQKKLNLPIAFMGIGEGIDSLVPFNPKDFVSALFE